MAHSTRAPLKSFLMLGGATLLTLEMLFETSGLGTPRLIVLSACETGLYDVDSFPTNSSACQVASCMPARPASSPRSDPCTTTRRHCL